LKPDEFFSVMPAKAGIQNADREETGFRLAPE
jgi:hypothetical protein